MAYLLCGDWHLADNLVQETLGQVLQALAPGPAGGEPGRLRAGRMLINEARRHWRRHGGTAVADGSLRLGAPGVPDDAAAVTNRVALFQRPAEPPGPATGHRRPALPGGDGASGSTAAILGCGEGTVKSQTSRALNTLGCCLKHKELPI